MRGTGDELAFVLLTGPTIQFCIEQQSASVDAAKLRHTWMTQASLAPRATARPPLSRGAMGLTIGAQAAVHQSVLARDGATDV